MDDHRHTIITINEHAGNTRVFVKADERVEFTLQYTPKTFADPRVRELESVVESQRNEITKANNENGILKIALAEAKKAQRNGKAHSRR